MSGGDKPKVLMIAFACNPEGSGEHWLGWGWAEQASKSFRVHLIASANARRTVGITLALDVLVRIANAN